MAGSLSDLRVLELGAGVSAAFAARLFGDHGADVVKVETPEGDWTRRRGPFPGETPDPERSGLFLAINTNKRGVCLDLERAAGRAELEALVDWADVLVQNLDPATAERLGTDPDALAARRPDLVALSIRPFGLSGPCADFHAHELTVSAAGGWANLCPAATDDPSLPPLKVFGHQCAFMSGVSQVPPRRLAAWSAARTSGVGEFIDFSEQDYTASVLEAAIPQYSYTGVVPRRYAPRGLIPWKIFDCADDPLFVACIEPDQWDRLVEFMGTPEWTSLEVFERVGDRARNHDLVHTFVQEWMAERKALETYHALQERRVCAAPVMSLRQIAESEHLHARGVLHRGGARRRGSSHASRARGPGRRGAPTDPEWRSDRLGEHDGDILGGRAPARAATARGREQLGRVTGASAGRGTRGRPLLGLGGPLLRHEPGPPGRRGHPLRVADAPGPLPPHGDSRQGLREDPRHLRDVQAVEPGQAERGAQPGEASGGGRSSAT